MSRTTAAAEAPVIDQPVPPRLVIDPTSNRFATMDGRRVSRHERQCRDCSRPIIGVSEVRTFPHPGPGKYEPPSFPGPVSRCPRCDFAELVMQDRWSFGCPSHETLRQAIEATEGGTRPSELRLAADLGRQLAELGEDDGFKLKLGVVRVGENTAKHGIYGEALIRPLLKRHATGDHGHFGMLPTGVSAEASFWTELASQSERNFLAIRDRLGFVRSSFDVQHLDPHQENRPFSSVVRLATFIDGDTSSTLIVAEGRSQANI